MAVYDLWVPDYFSPKKIIETNLFLTYCVAHSNAHLAKANFIEMQNISFM